MTVAEEITLMLAKARKYLASAETLRREARQRLNPYFPPPPEGDIDAYIWARTVACPVTGKPVPLSPNWWLQKSSDPVAVELLAKPEWPSCRFRIVQGGEVQQVKPDNGTIKKGVGLSPWSGEPKPGV